MNELALFAGCGGGILGAKLLGWRTVCAVEIDPFRCERLAQRQNEGFLPPFPIWNGDIADFDGRPWRGIVDVVSGGFPCQDISAANPNAQGITGARSGLWKEMLRIIREVGPRYCFVENSPMLTGRGLGVVLGDLAALGYDAQWGVLGADDLGGFHRRERLFLIGVALGHADQARLEGHAGNISGCDEPKREPSGPEGFIATPDVCVLAHGGIEWRRPEHEQQERERGRPWEQPDGRSETVADAACIRQSSKGNREINPEADCHGKTTRFGRYDAVCDAVWNDADLIKCEDGKLRATKPGLYGMAHGVANRMDRIAAIGDGQVPVVVSAAFQILQPIADLLRKEIE